MTTSTMELLPGTEVHARGLRWEVVSSQSLGPQTLFRLRGWKTPYSDKNWMSCILLS